MAPNVPLANEPEYPLNFNYTVFGQILTGQDIYNDILNIPTTSSGGIHYANNPVTITSASVITDNQHTILQISEPSNFTGNATITVTANASDNTSATRTFNISAAAPATAILPLFLNPVSNVTTANGASVSFQINATSVSQIASSELTFSVTGTDSFRGAPVNVNVTVTPGIGNNATITLTPTGGVNNSVINLVAHVDDVARNIHDALPFELVVGITADSVTSPINSTNFTSTAIHGMGEVGATITVTATDGTHTSAPKAPSLVPTAVGQSAALM